MKKLHLILLPLTIAWSSTTMAQTGQAVFCENLAGNKLSITPVNAALLRKHKAAEATVSLKSSSARQQSC